MLLTQPIRRRVLMLSRSCLRGTLFGYSRRDGAVSSFPLVHRWVSSATNRKSTVALAFVLLLFVVAVVSLVVNALTAGFPSVPWRRPAAVLVLVLMSVKLHW